MSSFHQWRTARKKTPMPKKVTWICGNERVLVDEVLRSIRGELAPEPWDYNVLVAGEDTERWIWNTIRQHPMGLRGNRLTVVLHADRLRKEAEFIAYVYDRFQFPRNYVVFVSDDPELARKTLAAGERGKGDLTDQLLYLRSKGDMIECRSFTQATAKHAVTWVQERAKIKPNEAAHLLNRADGNLRLVRDVCDKLAVFDQQISMATINEMLAQEPQDSFINALFALDKKTALLALQRLPKEEWSRTLGLIDARLDLAGTIHDMMVERRSTREIAAAAGNKNFLVKDIMPVAKHYDAKRRANIRTLLAIIDEYTPVYPSGVFEAIIAFW